MEDGWYGVRTVLDQHLTKQLLLGKIFPGQKLKIYGAEVF